MKLDGMCLYENPIIANVIVDTPRDYARLP